MNSKSRIILLLDLDCFYAQCETVRLGLDQSLPLCLLQWNSALAVNYAARKYGLKRGASFETIQQQSNGQCIALHLPVITTTITNDDSSTTRPTSSSVSTTKEVDNIISQHHDQNILSQSHLQQEQEQHRKDKNDIGCDYENLNNNNNNDSIEALYNQEFNQRPEIKNELFQKEKNKMRHGYEGKASLERYRLASTRIFQIMLEALDQYVGKGNFILEKASIDELYLDVSQVCYDFSREFVWKENDVDTDTAIVGGSDDGIDDNDDGGGNIAHEKYSSLVHQLALRETIICAQSNIHIDTNSDDIRALQRGCTIAKGIRNVVFDKLGFTLSAGISTSKLVAKLGASYGKPNGQAVILPDAIPNVMSQTPIRKVRNLGGKIGKEVLKLLPETETNMSSIAKYLSISDLTKALGSQSARMVWDACRGIDEEPVKATKGALTKSITAFKSFSPTNINHLQKWISLLASDVCSRVIIDSKRNNRFPKTCTIQYYYVKQEGKRIGSSARIPFPTISNYKNNHDKEEIISKFVQQIQETIKGKCQEQIVRLGLCAVGFIYQASTSGQISSFFQASTTSMASSLQIPKQKLKVDICTNLKDVEDSAQNNLQNNLQCSTKKQNDHKRSGVKVQDNLRTDFTTVIEAKIVNNDDDPDLVYALKLQASYDRENKILQTTDTKSGRNISTTDNMTSRHKKRAGVSHSKQSRCSSLKKNRIDSFFTEVKKR